MNVVYVLAGTWAEYKEWCNDHFGVVAKYLGERYNQQLFRLNPGKVEYVGTWEQREDKDDILHVIQRVSQERRDEPQDRSLFSR